MDVKTIQLDRAKAQVEYREYREAVKKNHDVDYLRDLKNAYGHARRGHPILDVWQAFGDTGLDANGDPKIAIARADLTDAHFTKMNPGDGFNGQGIFSDRQRWPHRRWNSQKLTDIREDDVIVPASTFKYLVDARGNPTRSHLATKVPIIPARFQPATGLRNYHILWEVEAWNLITPPRDPLLLKRISPNVFAVLAAWELTDLERTVLRGRIS